MAAPNRAQRRASPKSDVVSGSLSVEEPVVTGRWPVVDLEPEAAPAAPIEAEPVLGLAEATEKAAAAAHKAGDYAAETLIVALHHNLVELKRVLPDAIYRIDDALADQLSALYQRI